MAWCTHCNKNVSVIIANETYEGEYSCGSGKYLATDSIPRCSSCFKHLKHPEAQTGSELNKIYLQEFYDRKNREVEALKERIERALSLNPKKPSKDWSVKLTIITGLCFIIPFSLYRFGHLIFAIITGLIWGLSFFSCLIDLEETKFDRGKKWQYEKDVKEVLKIEELKKELENLENSQPPVPW